MLSAAAISAKAASAREAEETSQGEDQRMGGEGTHNAACDARLTSGVPPSMSYGDPYDP